MGEEKWIIIGVVGFVIVLLLAFVISLFFINVSDTRGLQLTGIWKTNDSKFPSVENQGKEIVYFVRFYNENNISIILAKVNEEFWNGSCYALPASKFVTLILNDSLYYSQEIYVEFYDGYIVKIANLSS